MRQVKFISFKIKEQVSWLFSNLELKAHSIKNFLLLQNCLFLDAKDMTIGKIYAAKLIYKHYQEITKGPRVPAVRKT